MKQCIAYRASRRYRSAWVRCARPRMAGRRFCRSHSNALDGAMLGLIVHGYPEQMARRTSTGPRVN